MNLRLIVPRSVSIEHCPNCDRLGSLDRIRVGSNYDNVLLKVFKIRSYHCRECKWIGKFFLYKLVNKPEKVLINYAIVLIIFCIFLLIVNYYIK